MKKRNTSRPIRNDTSILLGVSNPKKQPRKYSGQRIEEKILKRIEKVAKKQKTTPRAVWEQLAERGLPALEELYGLSPDEPTEQLPPSESSPKPGPHGQTS